jgi:cytochrome P450 family 4 subfamily V
MLVTESVIAGLLLALVGWILSAWTRHRKFRQIINRIPGTDGRFPVIGDIVDIKTDNLGFFNQVADMCNQHLDDGIVKFWLGQRPMLWTYRAHTIEKLMNSTKHISKSHNAYHYMREWLNDGLLMSTGKKWFDRRRLITPSFHFKILDSFVHVFNENSAILVGLLDSESNDGTNQFDFQPYIYRCMLDSICDTAMGVKVNAQLNSESAYVTSLYRLSELTMYRMKCPWLWSTKLLPLFSTGREFNACLKVLHDFTKKVIKDRRRELMEHRQDNDEKTTVTPTDADADNNIYIGSKRRRIAFVDMLLTTAINDPSAIDDEGIQEEVDTFMFEGHDTTATAVVFIMHMLACYPSFQDKVYQEIVSVLGETDRNREVTSEDVSHLKYMECFIKESLRLYPAVIWYGRTTSEDCKIGKYDIPAGVDILLNLYVLHRDPKHFPDPEKFDPGRWTSDETIARHPFCYLPFSAGLRNCIGQKFAMLEMKIVLCHLLRRFEIRGSFTREDIIPMATLILKTENNLPLLFKRRNNQA